MVTLQKNNPNIASRKLFNVGWKFYAIVSVALILLAVYFSLFITREDENVIFKPNLNFSLLNEHGEVVNQDIFKNQRSIVFFGFLNCPAICPTTMNDLSLAIDELHVSPEKLKVYFISLDPKRDRPDNLKPYVQSFGKHFTALTGTSAEISNLAKAWGVAWARVDLEDGDYTIDHSTRLYFINKNAAIVDMARWGEDQQDLLLKVKKHSL